MIRKILAVALLLMLLSGCVGTMQIADGSKENSRGSIAKTSQNINSKKDIKLKK